MKKISQIISYSILAVVVVGLVLCAIIKVNFRPEIALPTTGDVIEIRVDGTAKVESSNENINYKEFTAKFDEAFKLTILYSFFSGRLGSELKIDEVKSEPAYNGFKVLFRYGQTQTLKKDGKEVPVADNSSTPITFDSVIFDVAEDKGLAVTNLYVYKNGATKYYKISTIANFDGLYDYIKEIPMFAD